MKLHFLGACGEVGRSAILLESEKRLMLDYGVKIGGDRTEFPLPHQGFLDGLVLSHAHLDHCGNAPSLYEFSSIPFFSNYPTKALCELLINDSMKVARMRGEKLPFIRTYLKRLLNSIVPLSYGRPFILTHRMELTFWDAGHIPGSCIVEVNTEGKRVVYTGDFKLEQTLLQRRGELMEKVDVLIIESTYSDREHPERKELERMMVKEVRETLESGGNVLFPAFAVGRSQELIIFVSKYLSDVPAYLDGMSKTATRIISEYPGYVRDASALKKAMKRVQWIENDAQRRRALSSPSIIISSAGMLNGGPALSYLLGLNENSKIILTGYQVEGTNARMLMEEGKVNVDGVITEINLPVRYYDMSAHAGRNDLFEFVRRANPEMIFCVHGDKTWEFAQELREMGYNAVAPKLGESFEV